MINENVFLPNTDATHYVDSKIWDEALEKWDDETKTECPKIIYCPNRFPYYFTLDEFMEMIEDDT